MLALDDFVEKIERRVHPQDVGDGPVGALYRNVNENTGTADIALKEIGNGRVSGSKYLAQGNEIWPDRQGRAHRESGVHQLLTIFVGQLNICSRVLLGDDPVNYQTKGCQIA